LMLVPVVVTAYNLIESQIDSTPLLPTANKSRYHLSISIHIRRGVRKKNPAWGMRQHECCSLGNFCHRSMEIELLNCFITPIIFNLKQDDVGN
jgi:hypothetical protein